jgi:hypothetical protein
VNPQRSDQLASLSDPPSIQRVTLAHAGVLPPAFGIKPCDVCGQVLVAAVPIEV